MGLVDDLEHLIHSTNESNSTQFSREATEHLEVFAKDGGKIFVLCSGCLMTAFLLGHCIHMQHLAWLPESVMVVALGAAVGVVLPFGDEAVSHWAIKHITIQEESIINRVILNWFLLPMIIFEAGWSLRHRDFISQFPYILLFAIFGTLISMAVVGALILATGHLHGVTQPRVAFAYAALISAVDPVATLATYAHLNVDPLLNTLVFGESVINDAVAIVLFKALNDMSATEFAELTGGQLVGKLTSGVFMLLTCSLGLGVLLGAVYILLMRWTALGHSASLSALFVFFSSFFTYNFAESVCGQSGIIAVLFCAMLMGGYATPHLTPEGTMFTSFLLKQMASVGDMVVFLFVGIAVVYIKRNGLIFGCWVMLFCLVGRLVATLPLGVLTNWIKLSVGRSRPMAKRHLLSWRHILMIWHSGLRGGIALVLTLDLGEWVNEIGGPDCREKLRNATVVVICAFLLAFGGTTECLLRRLGIPMGSQVKTMEHHRGTVKDYLSQVRKSVLLPLLVGRGIPKTRSTDTVVGGVLEDAAEDPARIPSRDTVRKWAARYQLFGTYDPTHSEEVGGARRRGVASGGPEGEDSLEEGSDEEEQDSEGCSSQGSAAAVPPQR